MCQFPLLPVATEYTDPWLVRWKEGEKREVCMEIIMKVTKVFSYFSLNNIEQTSSQATLGRKDFEISIE